MSDTRARLPADSNYYPRVSELMGAENADLSVFLSRSKKATLQRLLPETLSQLSQSL